MDGARADPLGDLDGPWAGSAPRGTAGLGSGSPADPRGGPASPARALDPGSAVSPGARGWGSPGRQPETAAWGTQESGLAPDPDGVINPEEPHYEAIPAHYNAPPRTDGANSSKMTAEEQWRRMFGRLKGPNREYSEARPGLRDYQMLVEASKRAGDRKKQMVAHYCQGVMYDNMGEHRMAIRSYQSFLALGVKLGDVRAQSIAYNCIGIAMHRLGEWKQAVQYHKRHRRAAGPAGAVVALCNEGLAHRRLGDLESAESYHKRALQLAIQHEDLPGESLAAGQLGMDRLQSVRPKPRPSPRPPVTAPAQGTRAHMAHGRRNLERHAALEASRLGVQDDEAGQGEDGAPSPPPKGRAGRKGSSVSRAYQELGLLARRRGAYIEAMHHFQRSRVMAAAAGDGRTNDLDKCHMGVALGQQKLREYLQSLQRGDDGAEQ